MFVSRLLIVSFFALFLGGIPTQAQQDEQTGEGEAVLQSQRAEGKGSKSDPETAKIIRQLAAAAAGIADADFKELVTTGTTPSIHAENQTLSFVIVCNTIMDLRAEDYKDYHAEFDFSSSSPDPNKLVGLLKPTDTVNCWTALHPKYITNVTCDVEDDSTATGVISFDAEMYAGHVHYLASKEEKNWEINEFSFPLRDWRFVRGEDGNWQWHDHFGHIKKDRVLPKQNVTGQILLDDKPISAELYFYMRDYPEFDFPAQTNHKGEFKVSLPTGKYIVTCRRRGQDDRYQRRSTSDLTATVGEDQSELILNMKSTASERAEAAEKNEVKAKSLIATLQGSLASGELKSNFTRDLETLVNMDVPESSRAAAAEISKAILISEFKSQRKTSPRHAAIDGLLKWATDEDQNRILCKLLSSRSWLPTGSQGEAVFNVVVENMSQRGLKLVIRRLSRYHDDDTNPAVKALIRGGAEICEESLIAAAKNSKSTREKSFLVLKVIGTERCIPLLERLEQESKNEDDRNKIQETRKKMLNQFELP